MSLVNRADYDPGEKVDQKAKTENVLPGCELLQDTAVFTELMCDSASSRFVGCDVVGVLGQLFPSGFID